MPMTEADIIAGAEARTRALLERQGDGPDRLAVGLEGGLDPVTIGGRTHYSLKTWACVSDGCTWSVGAGGTVLVPDPVVEAVLAGHELGDVIDGLAGAPTRDTRGAWGVITRDLISRRDAFTLAVLSACAPFYNPEVFS
jgi:non-canonical (house-cleaning) NTP pyrophosphatase